MNGAEQGQWVGLRFGTAALYMGPESPLISPVPARTLRGGLWRGVIRFGVQGGKGRRSLPGPRAGVHGRLPGLEAGSSQVLSTG